MADRELGGDPIQGPLVMDEYGVQREDDGSLSVQRRPRPRVAQVKIRLPWVYKEPGNPGGIRPGAQGLVDTRQLRAMISAVRRAQKQGIVSTQAARAEMEQLRHGIRVIETSNYEDVGVWAPADQVIRPRARRR